MSSSTEEPIINEYEALRQAKIARNEARLRSLGLLQATPAPKPTVVAATTAPTRSVTPNAGPLRRSKRTRKAIHASLEEQNTKHPRVQEQEDADPRKQTLDRDDEDYRPTAEEELEHLDEDKATKKNRNVTRPSRKSSRSSNISQKSPPPSTPQLSPNSARAMKLNVTQLLTNAVMGKTLTKTGKAHVMEESARLAVDGYNGKSPISFNKYSGVQEWGNQVLFLWINLGAPNSDVTNDFPQEGRHVTWFGGSRMHKATPVIQRLIAIGKKPPADGGVVLWCRRYLKDRKTFEPYTCLGRLSYVSHEPESHPLAFIWKLEDFERISNHADEKRRETFQAMVQGS